MKNSSYDGRARRTMQQAFGPYTSHKISEPRPTGYPVWWWISMAVIAAATIFVLWSTR